MTSHGHELMTGAIIHHSYLLKRNIPLMCYDEPLTRNDNRINDPPILLSQKNLTPGRVTTDHELVPITGSMIHQSYQVKGNNPVASYDEPRTRTDNRINDPQSTNLIKTKGTTPWRETTSHWLVPITGSIIYPPFLVSQGEYSLGELRRATDSYR